MASNEAKVTIEPSEELKELLEGAKIGARNNRMDKQTIQHMHDASVMLGAMCEEESKSSYLPDNANALKTVGKTDDELRVANYIVLFGGRDLTSFASGRGIAPNPDGSLGEFFSERTDFESDYTKTGMLYVDFEHSLDPDGLGIGSDDVLGYVDWKTAKKDERGLFVERVLLRRQKYVQFLEELIDAGLIGNSSETIRGKAKRTDEGEIIAWPLKRDTLTVNPMEPRMLSGNQLQAVKALADVMPEFKSLLIPSDAAQDDKEDRDAAKSAKENIEMEANEIKTALGEFKSELLTELKAEAATAAKAAVTEVLDNLPEVKAKMNGKVQVTEDEADRPFKNVAEQLLAVKNLSAGRVDPRMKRIQAKSLEWMAGAPDEAKALLGSNEIIPSQGEFLLEPTISAEFLKPLHEEGPLTGLARRMPVGPNSINGWINGVDETSRAAGSRWGGVRGYWLSAGDTMTASQPKFKRINWELNQLAVLQYATDNMLRDAALMDSVIRQSALEELKFMVNDAFMRGSGAGQPKGVLNGGAVLSVTRTDANNVDHADITRMVARINPDAYARMVWLASPNVMPEIDTLNFTAGSTGILSPYVTYGANGVTSLRGRPVIYNEFSPSLGAVGDLLLWDPADYLYWEGAGVEGASSIHVQFLTNQTVFRFIYRVDGMPATTTALTPYQSTDTVSPYVALAATT
jgi:HK97 family phage major capsid protein